MFVNVPQIWFVYSIYPVVFLKRILSILWLLKYLRFVYCLFVFLFFSVIQVGLHFNKFFMGLIRWPFMLWKSLWIQILLIKRDIIILYTDKKLGHFQCKTHWFQMHFRFQNVKNERDIQCSSYPLKIHL